MDAQIYLVTNQLNGKQYVGQTINPHLHKGHGRILVVAYKKYGFDNFTYEPICHNIDNRHTLNYVERFWIQTIDTMIPNGYNIESGGASECVWTEERRRNASVSRLGKKINRPLGSISGMRGKKFPEAGKQKLSAINKGNKFSLGVFPSEETKAKMSASQKLKAASFAIHPNLGRQASEETKAKMRASRAKRVYTDAHKQIISEAVTAWHKQRKDKKCL